MELKKLSPRNNELNFRQGVNFGMGFFLAAAVWLMVIIPIATCATAIVLSVLGVQLAN